MNQCEATWGNALGTIVRSCCRRWRRHSVAVPTLLAHSAYVVTPSDLGNRVPKLRSLARVAHDLAPGPVRPPDLEPHPRVRAVSRETAAASNLSEMRPQHTSNRPSSALAAHSPVDGEHPPPVRRALPAVTGSRLRRAPPVSSRLPTRGPPSGDERYAPVSGAGRHEIDSAPVTSTQMSAAKYSGIANTTRCRRWTGCSFRRTARKYPSQRLTLCAHRGEPTAGRPRAAETELSELTHPMDTCHAARHTAVPQREP